MLLLYENLIYLKFVDFYQSSFNDQVVQKFLKYLIIIYQRFQAKLVRLLFDQYFQLFERFHLDDRFEEIIIKLYKDKIRLLSNTNLEKFLWEIIILNILFLYKIKKIIARVTQFTLYKSYYSLISFIFDLSLLVKILVKDRLLELKARYSKKNTKFVDFLIHRLTKIIAKSPLKKY